MPTLKKLNSPDIQSSWSKNFLSSAPQAKILWILEVLKPDFFHFQRRRRKFWEFGKDKKPNFFPFVVRVISKNCVKIAWKPWKSANAIRNSQFLFRNPQTQSATRNFYFKIRKRNPQLAIAKNPAIYAIRNSQSAIACSPGPDTFRVN